MGFDWEEYYGCNESGKTLPEAIADDMRRRNEIESEWERREKEEAENKRQRDLRASIRKIDPSKIKLKIDDYIYVDKEKVQYCIEHGYPRTFEDLEKQEISTQKTMMEVNKLVDRLCQVNHSERPDILDTFKNIANEFKDNDIKIDVDKNGTPFFIETKPSEYGADLISQYEKMDELTKAIFVKYCYAMFSSYIDEYEFYMRLNYENDEQREEDLELIENGWWESEDYTVHEKWRSLNHIYNPYMYDKYREIVGGYESLKENNK